MAAASNAENFNQLNLPSSNGTLRGDQLVSKAAAGRQRASSSRSPNQSHGWAPSTPTKRRGGAGIAEPTIVAAIAVLGATTQSRPDNVLGTEQDRLARRQDWESLEVTRVPMRPDGNGHSSNSRQVHWTPVNPRTTSPAFADMIAGMQ